MPTENDEAREALARMVQQGEGYVETNPHALVLVRLGDLRALAGWTPPVAASPLATKVVVASEPAPRSQQAVREAAALIVEDWGRTSREMGARARDAGDTIGATVHFNEAAGTVDLAKRIRALPAPEVTEEMVERAARQWCVEEGLDPEALDVMEYCDAHNRPLPLWQAYEVSARKILLAALGTGGEHE